MRAGLGGGGSEVLGEGLACMHQALKRVGEI